MTYFEPKVVAYVSAGIVFMIVGFLWENPFTPMSVAILGYAICVAAISIGAGAAWLARIQKDEGRL
jgi:hypothetical protein